MGNRAVIAFKGNRKQNSKCLYLHWNGGRASVDGFLDAAKKLNIPRPYGTPDGCYHDEAIVNLANLVGRHYFGKDPGVLNTYIEPYSRADKDNGDNGLYLIDNNFEIVGREFNAAYEEVDPAKTQAITEWLLQRAPIFNN